MRPRPWRWPLGTALVSGASMLPALHPGDCLLVRPGPGGRRVRPGDVVVAEPVTRPGLLVVKRAVRTCPDGTWWVEGDNPDEGDDSRTFGPVRVVARVVLRWWPPGRAGRVPGRLARPD